MKKMSEKQLSIDDLKADLEEKAKENKELNNKIKLMELENREVEIKFQEWEASFTQ